MMLPFCSWGWDGQQGLENIPPLLSGPCFLTPSFWEPLEKSHPGAHQGWTLAPAGLGNFQAGPQYSVDKKDGR